MFINKFGRRNDAPKAPLKNPALAYEKDLSQRAKALSDKKALLFACCAAARLLPVYERGVMDVSFWDADALNTYLDICWQVLETGTTRQTLKAFDPDNFIDGQKREAALLLEPVVSLAQIIDVLNGEKNSQGLAARAAAQTLNFLDGALDEYVHETPSLWDNPPAPGEVAMTGLQAQAYAHIIFNLPLTQNILSEFERDLTELLQAEFKAQLVRKMRRRAESESILKSADFVPRRGLMPLP